MNGAAPDDVRARVEKALAGTGHAHRVRRVERLVGGASGLTYRVWIDDHEWGESLVVKVAPAGLEPRGNRDVLRQAKLLTALHAVGTVPVPQVVFTDAGDPPGTPPLFAMSFVDGDSFEPLFDDPGTGPALDATTVQDRAIRSAIVLASLHQIDVATHGLDHGEPVVDARHEIDRWAAALRTVDPSLAPGWEACAEALGRCVPEPLHVVVNHGDYRLGNMLAVGREVRAVIDWELWGLGDPRFDLGWLRLNADPDTYRRDTPLGAAMPHPDVMLAAYEAERGAPVPDMVWFDALARFKATATWSLILKRARKAGSEAFADVAPALPRLTAKARELVG